MAAKPVVSPSIITINPMKRADRVKQLAKKMTRYGEESMLEVYEVSTFLGI